MQSSLAGRTAIVTGAGRGIGAAIARGLARAGANVVLASRTQTQLDAGRQAIETEGGKALAVALNLAEPGSAADLVQRTVDHFGGLDVLVCNAAANSVIKPIAEIALQDWRTIQTVNVEGTIALLQAAAPHLLGQGSGSVVIVSSTLGMNGNPFSGAYGASKAALNHLTRTVAAEWGPRGVRVNGLLPGPTETERVRAVVDDPVLYEKVRALMPLGRWPSAEDLVDPAVFLASDASRCITGHLLVVDSGLSSMCREAGLARSDG